ncbi:MAG: MogA/MoaB family molybdenum cofactor biosynthesis protein [Bryobacteraceae bacterium]|jgi:molybdenum cofactor synthesis domain-containing protein
MIRTAVVTISDSVARGTREDRSGIALRQRAEQLGWQVAETAVVEDDRESIARLLADLSDRRSVSLILTTGGTGIAQRDVTPEATRAVVDREIPGLGELMRAEGRRFTPRAVLSRGIAGTRGRTLIVNLPGSPKGAVESLDAVAALAPHIIDLLEGRTEHN